MNVTYAKILKEAREYVANPETWTKGTSSVDAYGNWVRPTDPRACRWCSTGAVHKVLHEHDMDYHEATREVLGLLDETAELLFPEWGSVVDVNDLVGREEALAVFDATIKELT